MKFMLKGEEVELVSNHDVLDIKELRVTLVNKDNEIRYECIIPIPDELLKSNSNTLDVVIFSLRAIADFLNSMGEYITNGDIKNIKD